MGQVPIMRLRKYRPWESDLPY